MQERVVELNWFLGSRLNNLVGSKLNRQLAEKGGIYSWVYLNKKASRVAYIGETGNFHKRFVQHFTSLFAGQYTTFRLPDDKDHFQFFLERIHQVKPETFLKDPDVAWPGCAKGSVIDLGEYFGGQHRRQVASHYADRLSFWFAEAEGLKNRQERGAIETILMFGVLKVYADELWGGNLSKAASNWQKSDTTPFGKIFCHPDKNVIYRIEHNGPAKDQSNPAFPSEILSVVGWADGKPILKNDQRKAA